MTIQGRNGALMRSRRFETKEGEPTGPALRAIEDLKSEFLKHHKELGDFVVKANAEIKALGATQPETKAALEKTTELLNTLGTRLDKIEAKANRLRTDVDP